MSFDEFHTFAAYDGTQLEWSDELEAIITRYNRYNSRASVAGCALSHLALWTHIATTKGEYHLIMEDDAMPVAGWIDRWNSEYYYAMPLNSFVVSQSLVS